MRYSRFLIWSCDCSLLLSEGRTINRILRIVAWSLNCLYVGMNPTSGPGGVPLTSQELKRAGTPIVSDGRQFQLIEVRGDWEFHCRIWRTNASWNGRSTCFKCSAVSVGFRLISFTTTMRVDGSRKSSPMKSLLPRCCQVPQHLHHGFI